MKKLALALGTFDGLHRGHLNVLNEAKAFAEDGFTPAMLMFDIHPQAVLKGIAPPLLITSEDKEEKAKELEVLPVHISFEEIRNLSPEDFLRDILIKKHNVGAVICGENFLFGKDGGGNSKILCELCEKYGIIYKMARSIEYKGEMISATRIRKSLADGDIKTANEMLGRNFSYDFLVVEGNKIGKKIEGSVLAILILVAPTIFSPSAITIIEPTTEISLMHPSKIPLSALAPSSIEPW